MRGGARQDVVVTRQVGNSCRDGVIPEEEIMMVEEGACDHQTGGGLEISPPGSSLAITYVLGIHKQGHVGGEEGNVEYPRGEFELAHGAINMGVIPQD